MKTVKDFNFKNKKVLLRVDFNVPLDDNGEVKDDFRIKQTIPTLIYLQNKGAMLLLTTHRSDKKSLAPAWKRLGEYIDIKDIEFLDNLRLNKGEETNSQSFSKELSSLADIYINDAFGVCHRKHASVVGITKYLPSGAGLLLEKEVKILSKVLENPKRPLTAIIGGAKIESKAKVIKKFLEIADNVLIGGKIGFSLKPSSDKLHVPIDYKDKLDIGPKTIKIFQDIIKKSGTIIWAGPMGKFEDPSYEKGTKEIAKEIANSRAFKIAGGGDTISALKKYNLRDKFDHISTGGGAMLAFLAEEELPGLKVLEKWK